MLPVAPAGKLKGLRNLFRLRPPHEVVGAAPLALLSSPLKNKSKARRLSRPSLAVANAGSASVSVLLGNGNVATHFLLSAPSNTTAGASFTLSVRALDGANRQDGPYAGTVWVSSSDPAFTPFAYTFAPTDLGSHTFTLSLPTKGVQSLTVTDLNRANVLGSAEFVVL
jgi:hypothetical protein